MLVVATEVDREDMMVLEYENKSHRYPKRVVKIGPSYCSPYMDKKCVLSDITTIEETTILETILGTRMDPK